MVKILLFIFISLSVNVNADSGFLLKKINANFNQTWYSLYNQVKKSGYQTTYLQRCDFALKQRKYESNKYRILFFGKYENMEYLSKKYPKIVPFLPLKVVVIEEKNQTLLLANMPNILLEIVRGGDVHIINKWQKDMEDIFTKIQNRYKQKPPN